MLETRYGRNLAAMFMSLLLTACAALTEPIKIGKTEASNGHSRGVLWPHGEYERSLFDRQGFAEVISVDGIRMADGFFSKPTPLIELSAGEHEVSIKASRASYFPTPAGGFPLVQTVVSVVLNVETGHSYLPLYYKVCGRDWVWVIDKGEKAEDDLRRWTLNTSTSLDHDMSWKDLSGFSVVAGEAPPDKCNSQ